MTLIAGTNVAAPVVPGDTADIFPSHVDQYGQGGYRAVANQAARDAIPQPRRNEGMWVQTLDDGTVWQLEADLTTWIEASSGGGGSGTAFLVTQVAHGFSLGEPLYFDGTQWQPAIANDPNKLAFGLVAKVIDANKFMFGIAGVLKNLTSLVAGQYYFVSDTTPGTLTTTTPSIETSYSNPIFFALTTTTGVILPFRPSNVVSPTPNLPSGLFSYPIYIPVIGQLVDNQILSIIDLADTVIFPINLAGSGVRYLTTPPVTGQPYIINLTIYNSSNVVVASGYATLADTGVTFSWTNNYISSIGDMLVVQGTTLVTIQDFTLTIHGTLAV